MKSRIYRFELFDAGCLFLLFCATARSIFAFRVSYTLLGAILIPVALYFLIVLCGRLACPYYFEKLLVSILLKNNNRMKLKHLEGKYDDPDTFDFALDRLKKRNNVRIEEDTVRLDEENVKKGLRNFIMMWGIHRL